jgi:hypothetical protein
MAMISEKMVEINYQFLPSAFETKLINDEVKNRLSKSFSYLSELVANVIGEPLSQKLLSVSARIDSADRTDGYVYALYHELLHAIKNNKIENVKELVLNLSNYVIPSKTNVTNFSIPALGEDKYNLYKKYVNRDDAYELALKGCADDDFLLINDYIHQGIKIFSNIEENFCNHVFAIVGEIVILDVIKGPVFHSGTTFDTYGTIYIGKEETGSILSYLDKIVHEASHLFVYALNIADELVLNPYDQRFQSPFRQDTRPMIGIYHATFVAARLKENYTWENFKLV